MNFINIKRSLILWVSAFIGAFSLHVGLGAQFYSRDTGISNGMLSQTVMLTFEQDQEVAYSDMNMYEENIDTEDTSNTNTVSETLHSDLLEPSESVEEIQPEESQNIVEKNDFTVSIPQIEQKVHVKKALQKPKSIVKQQSSAKMKNKSAARRNGDMAAFENALLAEWLAKVQAQLEKQKKYVMRQYTSRAKGTVQLEFRVHEQGDIFSSRIVTSSGNIELDQLAMSALKRVGSFPFPPPSKVNKIMRVSLIFS
ncbi:energy transducer TonB [Bartonella sp. CB189]|uniref:energy transducer TonB n=1 Tax=Bartonella sp. CB189 TaxID=3112254 RepID=UPI002F9614C2